MMLIRKLVTSSLLVFTLVIFSQTCDAQITGEITPNPYKTGDKLSITPSTTATTPANATNGWGFVLIVKWDAIITIVGGEEESESQPAHIIDQKLVQPGESVTMTGTSTHDAPDLETFGCKVVLCRWAIIPGIGVTLIPVDSEGFDAAQEDETGEQNDHTLGMN